MKKHVHLLLALLFLPLLTIAQNKVAASEIIAKINRGEAVNYKNAEITGNLDMTKLQNMKLKNEKAGKNDTKEHISTVIAPLVFENCTFKGDVLAYFNPDNGVKSASTTGGEVYNTDFKKEVRFENCTFEAATAFKYSDFEQEVSFAGSRFAEEALFKYSKFAKAADFSKATFADDANFKYTAFRDEANFKGAVFEDDADFKYAKFETGADLQRSVFEGLANFKYTHFSKTANLDNVSFKGGTDFKYTRLNNRPASLIPVK
ncbi:pentapeptide repeat-containing protein [Pontibacter sp. Tf4]|uniref:pentapeptide repeat-containing protein n=1 Tax=Pontibacter sp. Tf4 TaxID=2761620 RepID=UPI0016233D8A|nr:pentapeptide repeat-containing protein [Pontibacter sp. Tf4]MBB6611525.1 pentapeptide repeat-containing protein [Pontibacter sp. Tf4]